MAILFVLFDKLIKTDYLQHGQLAKPLKKISDFNVTRNCNSKWQINRVKLQQWVEIVVVDLGGKLNGLRFESVLNCCHNNTRLL